MLSLTLLKKLPQLGVTSLHRSVGSAASMRGNTFGMHKKVRQYCSQHIVADEELDNIQNNIDYSIEKWADIPNYEGLYMISDCGRVKSYPKISKSKNGLKKTQGKIIKQFLFQGYFKVALIKNHKTTTRYIHRLIAESFIPNPKNKPQINHINGIKHDNSISNLEWVTDSENKFHAQDMGLNPYTGFNDKPCIQLTITGEKVNEFKSLTEAFNSTGISHIGCCIKGTRKTAGGFKWKYKTNDNEADLTTNF